MTHQFFSEALMRMVICYTVLYLTGLLVSKKKVKVNYTRKINHFTLLFLSFAFGSGSQSAFEIDIVNEIAHLVTERAFLCGLLYFIVLLKPVRDRVSVIRTAFSGINRPEDEPHTLFWMTTQAVAEYAAAILVSLYLGWIGKPELILVIILIYGIGDGLAEPIGIRFGRHKYEANGLFVGKKYVRSVEGSACVFLVSLVAVILFCSSFSSTQFAIALFVFPALMTIAEAKAPHSWDNPLFFVIGGVLLFLIFQFTP